MALARALIDTIGTSGSVVANEISGASAWPRRQSKGERA